VRAGVIGRAILSRTMTLDDEALRAFMREAIDEGKKALPGCRPNPPVGCVLVRGGMVIARGFTQVPYQPHAEPMALAQVEGDLTDVTAFVTLEPCAFHQRTPSCAREMIARRVGAVYVAMIDPHPKNQGRGIEMLRAAGIPVVTDFLREEAVPHLGPYLHGGLHGSDGSDPPMGW
jgi:pyrimidine deaminase RibD-like protein